MKVLIATQDQYVPFIMSVIEPYDNSEHIVIMNFNKPTSDFTDYDVGISFMWDRKIQKFELEIAPWINFHPGPLPEYKGRNLCYHAIMNGEKVFGATVHYMDENFDTGPIIDVLYFPVEDWMTAGDVHEQVIEASKKLFIRHFMAIVLGVNLHSYENTGGTYYQKMPIQGEIHLDDETKRQIRAITCYPYVPRVYIGGKMYKIVRCE